MAPRKTAVKESKRFLKYLLLGAAIIFSFAISLSSTKSQAQDHMIEISSKEIIERLARLEEGQKTSINALTTYANSSYGASE